MAQHTPGFLSTAFNLPPRPNTRRGAVTHHRPPQHPLHTLTRRSRHPPTCAMDEQQATPQTFRARYGPWAVVTGASSGIGAEFARQLAAAGFHLVLVARRTDRLKMLSDALERSASVSTLCITADLSDAAGRSHVLQQTAELDVGLLINNAGVEFHGAFVHADDEAIERLIAINVTAVAVLARAFGNRFVKRGRGGIMFVSSVSSHGFPFMSAYAASKSFVSTLAISAGAELDEVGVTVMALEPGLVRSEMTLGKDDDAAQSENKDESGGWPSVLMDTDVCVREALEMFGKRTEYTPGLVNRTIRFLLLCLPRPLALRLMSMVILSRAPDLLDS